MVDPLNGNTEEAKSQNITTLKIILGIVSVFAVLCGLTAWGIYTIGRPYFEKTQIILEPDPSRVSTVDPADLKTAAEVLTARARSLGYSNVSFVATKNNQIIGQAPNSIDVETILKPITAIGLLEFVDLGETPLAEGMKVQTDFDYPYFPQAKGEIKHTIMTNEGFQEVAVITDQVGKPAISFMLTAEGTKIFADFTTKNVGHYLAIVLDKVVLSSPVINSAITEGNGIIEGSFTAEEANALAAYLRIKGPLPLPLIIKEIIKNGH